MMNISCINEYTKDVCDLIHIKYGIDENDFNIGWVSLLNQEAQPILKYIIIKTSTLANGCSKLFNDLRIIIGCDDLKLIITSNDTITLTPIWTKE